MTNNGEAGAYNMPVHPLINPLTEEDRIAIETVLNRLPMIYDLLHRAEQVGLDVAAHKDRHEMHKVIAERLHTHFFPKQLPAVEQ